MTQDLLAPFPASWPATRETLHGYLLAIAAVPRAHATPQPHWWHIGLRITADGLVTAPVDLPDGRNLTLCLDPTTHIARIDTSDGINREWRLDAGATASEFGNGVLNEVIGLGLPDTFDRDRFRSDKPTTYDIDAAEFFGEAVRTIEPVFEQRRAAIAPPTGPVLLWSHHFDISFEWYGTKMTPGEDGSEAPAQLNLGFYPGEDPYFYSNPWPFDEALVGTPLPEGAAWHTDGWMGTILPYESVVDDPTWKERLLEYAAEVHRIVRPTLTR